MKLFLYLSAPILAYLVGALNPAIAISKAVYKKDIRTCGSKNPGFTNFKRTFGGKWAWVVLVADLFKAALVTLIYAKLFERYFQAYSFGAVYTGFFALLGHSFPIWYGFEGGKGFLVTLSVMWVCDARVGFLATIIMIFLLLTTKYMSLSTVCALICCPILLGVFGADLSVVLISAAMALFVAFRHNENFKRLISGTENKFSFKK